jgi:5'-3' exonuclease
LSFAIDIPLENDDETKDTIAVMPAFKKQRIDEQGQAAVVEPNQQQIAALTEDINKREQEIAKKKSRIHLVDHSHYDVLKTMFDHFNIPYEEAPGEAEKYCVELCLQKRADVVVTNDADALVHGAPILLRYLFSSRFPTSMLYYDEVL